MKKFKNSNLSIYRGDNNPEENSSSLLSILGRVGLITFSMFIILVFFLYPVSRDIYLMSLHDKFGIVFLDFRFKFEKNLLNYNAYLYAQELVDQEQTVKEFFVRAFLEHREVVNFQHSDKYFALQTNHLLVPVSRYSSCGIYLVICFVYSVIGFLYVSLLAFFDFMLRKPVQNRGLSVYEEFVLDFVCKLPCRSILVAISMQLAIVLAYTFDGWMRI